jgi:hypothetical protein
VGQLSGIRVPYAFIGYERSIAVMRVAMVAVLVTLASSGARAQTAADTVDVLVVAFDSMVGAPTLERARGSAVRVCLGTRGARRAPAPPEFEWPPRNPVSVGPSYQNPLSQDLLDRLGRVLSSTRSVEIATGCRRVGETPSTRSLIRDSAGRPALSVYLGLQFTAPDVAWISVGLPHRLVECVLRRSDAVPWRAACRTILVS